MRQNVALVALGILIGMVLMLAAPGSAHHGSSYRDLRNRLERIESRMHGLDSRGYLNPVYIQRPGTCSSQDAAIWEVTGQGLGC
jgi:hypothetical protein